MIPILFWLGLLLFVLFMAWFTARCTCPTCTPDDEEEDR